MSDLQCISWVLLLDYIKGEATWEQQARVEEWLAEDSKRREMLSQMEQIWNTPTERKQHWDIEASFERYQEKYGAVEDDVLAGLAHTHSHSLASELETPFYDNEKNVRNLRIARKRTYFGARFGYSLAAGFILVLIASLFVMNMPADEPAQPTMQEIITKKGERTSLKLSDGSRVVLNAESRLQVPSDYGQSSRTLYLEGEAFFEVEHNEDKPFLIYTGDIYTEDLGTKFNIRTYGSATEDEDISVVVSEGKVELGSTNREGADSALIIPHQMGIIGKSGKVNVKEVEDLSLYLGWATGQLVFRDTPFGQVREELERWYDIEITVTDPALNDRRVSATYKDEPMGEVLNLIALSLEMEFTQDKRKVIFEPLKQKTDS